MRIRKIAVLVGPACTSLHPYLLHGQGSTSDRELVVVIAAEDSPLAEMLAEAADVKFVRLGYGLHAGAFFLRALPHTLRYYEVDLVYIDPSFTSPLGTDVGVVLGKGMIDLRVAVVT